MEPFRHPKRGIRFKRCRNWRLRASRRVRKTALQELRCIRLEGFLDDRFPSRTARYARDYQSSAPSCFSGELDQETGQWVQEENFRSRTTRNRRRLFNFNIHACFPKASPFPLPVSLCLPFIGYRGAAGTRPPSSNSSNSIYAVGRESATLGLLP